MLSVSELDSITGIAKIINGNVVSSKKGAFSFYDLPIIANLSGANTADDREWPPRWWPWQPNSQSDCFNNWSVGGGGWWGDFWSSIGSFFSSNIWDTEGGEHVSFPPFTFFFGNGFVNPGDGYVTPGGSSVFDQQFLNQSNTCTFIRQYIESIGEIPAGYSQAALRYCQLVSELGIDAASSRCLFAQYGSSFIDNFYEHWEQSDKSIATAELLKKYLSAHCGSSPSVLFADIIKQQFCLHGSSMDIWLEFTWEAAKIVAGQIPWVKALDVATQLRDMWKVIDKIDTLLGEIGEAAIERSWNILKNSPIKFSGKALKYVDDLSFPKLGGYFATLGTYNPRFKSEFADVADQIGEVHHAVPQWVLTRYPHLSITNDQMHSLENLRGIPNNGTLDHATITNYWEGFYNTNQNPTYQELMEFTKFIDDEFGHLFIPPVR